LPAAWSSRWQSAPGARLWLERDVSGEATAALVGGGRWWTAGEFDAATRRVAGRLQGAGLQPGDRVLWSTGSSVAALVAHVGALRAGLVVVPANIAYTRRELAHIVRDVRPAAAIVERPDHQDAVRRVSERAVLVVGPGVGLADADEGPLDTAGPGDPALILYTSGTTGVPKGAVLRHRNLLAGAESVRIAWRWSADDRLVHALPLFHAHGLCVGIYGTLLAGSSAVLLPAFDPAAAADAVAEHGASLFFGVPTMYHRLVRSRRATDLRRLRLCVSGSAPMSVELHRAMRAALGSTVLERYGMTETLMDLSNPFEGPRRPGTVGFPLPGVEARLGDDGELSVRGPNVFDGYWERPAANAEVFSASTGGGRWFRTGDQGADVDGYVVIRGRKTEMIISGGFNVYPAEVEDVLLTHPGVAEVAVTGSPSDEWGEVVTAWIVADGTPPSAEDLAAFTEATLAPYKRPRLVHVVDDLPRNALGKVVRNHLGRRAGG
jgi:malonyl-CoA/methylmalonyl-CoA synthetase